MWDFKGYGGYTSSYAYRLRRKRHGKQGLLGAKGRFRMVGVLAEVRKAPEGTLAKPSDPVSRAGLRALPKRGELAAVSARIFLPEIFPLAVFLFSEKPFSLDERVSLTLHSPRQFFAVGRVVSCRDYTQDSRVIPANGVTYKYRVAIKFEFKNERERHEIEAYVAKLRTPQTGR